MLFLKAAGEKHNGVVDALLDIRRRMDGFCGTRAVPVGSAVSTVEAFLVFQKSHAPSAVAAADKGAQWIV